MQAKNILDKKFHRLHVVSQSEKRTHWNCVCDCGNKIVVDGKKLRFGSVKSCGCLVSKNLVGERFGKLKVLEELAERKCNHKVWRCICECGNFVKYSTSELRSHKVSCGCYNPSIRDLTNKKFGKLSVVQQLVQRSRHRYVVWKCLCECGNVVEAKSSALLNGSTKSCGCLTHRTNQDNPRWKGFGEISGKKWSEIKRSAAVRGIQFFITIEEAWNVYLHQNKKCKLSGLDLSFGVDANYTASLDRIDNNSGYELGNIQWLHRDINLMKLTHSQDHFVFLCTLVAKL